MTDNENIKAFECCHVEDSCLDCNECPIKNKMVDEAPCYKCAAEIERLRDRNKFLEIEYKNQGNLFWERVQISNLSAIKEFAERLKEKVKMYNSEGVDEGDLIDDILTVGETIEIIDNLVKEMTEAQE